MPDTRHDNSLFEVTQSQESASQDGEHPRAEQAFDKDRRFLTCKTDIMLYIQIQRTATNTYANA